MGVCRLLLLTLIFQSSLSDDFTNIVYKRDKLDA